MNKVEFAKLVLKDIKLAIDNGDFNEVIEEIHSILSGVEQKILLDMMDDESVDELSLDNDDRYKIFKYICKLLGNKYHDEY